MASGWRKDTMCVLPAEVSCRLADVRDSGLWEGLEPHLSPRAVL